MRYNIYVVNGHYFAAKSHENAINEFYKCINDRTIFYSDKINVELLIFPVLSYKIKKYLYIFKTDPDYYDYNKSLPTQYIIMADSFKEVCSMVKDNYILEMKCYPITNYRSK
jgi:hypothetical protein